MKPFDIDRYDKMFIIDTNFLITFVSFEDRNITVLFVKEEHSLYNCFFLFFFWLNLRGIRVIRWWPDPVSIGQELHVFSVDLLVT